jgi:hypothetical protein
MNRIRAFPIGILCFVVFSTGYEFIVHQSFQSDETFFQTISYFCRSLQYSFLLLIAGISISLGLLIARWRVTRSMYKWNYYLYLSLLFIVPILTYAYWVLSNQGLTLKSEQTDVANTYTQQSLFPPFDSSKRHEGSVYIDEVKRGDYSIQLIGMTNNLKASVESYTQKWGSEHDRLIVKKKTSSGYTLLYNKSLWEIIDIQNDELKNEIREEDFIMGHQDKSLFFCNRTGLLTILVKLKTGKTDEWDIPESRLKYILYYRIALSDNIEITPLKQIDLSYHSPSGKKTPTIDCIQPGLFLAEEFNTLEKEFKSYKNQILPYDSVEIVKDTPVEGNDYANVLASKYMLRFLSIGHLFTPNGSTGNPIDDQCFFIDCWHDSDFRIWPVIYQYDLSSPNSLHVIAGTKSPSPLPKNLSSFVYYGVPYFYNKLGRSTNFLTLPCCALDGECLIIYDASDPNNIQEISRIQNSRWDQWMNWSLYDDPTYGLFDIHNAVYFQFVDDLIVIRSPSKIEVFQNVENTSLRPIARLIDKRRDRSISKATIVDKNLYVLYSDQEIQSYSLDKLN